MFISVGTEVIGHDHQRNHGHSKVITVSLNKVMSCNGRRIYMMFSKWTYK